MQGINKCLLVGTLGRDPETKTFPNGGSLTTISLATSDSWINKNTGQRETHTEWHRVVLHNRLGEVAQQYLKKGSKIYIEGSLRTRQWTDQSGQTRYTTEIRAEQMQMLDSPRQESASAPVANDQNSVAKKQHGNPPNLNGFEHIPHANTGYTPSKPQSNLDDDLPF